MKDKIDYFGLYEESESKPKTKILFNKTAENQILRVRKSANKIPQTPAMKART